MKTCMYRVIHKKVSHKTEDEMQEKMDKLQMVPASCVLLFTKHFLDDPLWNTEFGIHNSLFVQ